jgi:hypothetical protein
MHVKNFQAKKIEVDNFSLKKKERSSVHEHLHLIHE